MIPSGTALPARARQGERPGRERFRGGIALAGRIRARSRIMDSCLGEIVNHEVQIPA